MSETMTTSRASEIIGKPLWWIRRRLDQFQAQGVEVPRIGLYRLVTPALLARLRKEAMEDSTAAAS
jgi:hypothetical protein